MQSYPQETDVKGLPSPASLHPAIPITRYILDLYGILFKASSKNDTLFEI